MRREGGRKQPEPERGADAENEKRAGWVGEQRRLRGVGAGVWEQTLNCRSSPPDTPLSDSLTEQAPNRLAGKQISPI